MNVSIELPDDLGQRLKAACGDLSRHALETLGIEEYRKGRLSSDELRRLLGFSTGMALDGFLKERGIFLDYTMADLESERKDLHRLGL